MFPGRIVSYRSSSYAVLLVHLSVISSHFIPRRWALGALIFTLIVGDCPFGSWKDSELQVYTRIARRDFAMPEDISPEAADIIEKVSTF